MQDYNLQHQMILAAPSGFVSYTLAFTSAWSAHLRP